MGGQAPDDPLCVPADTVQRGRRQAALPFQQAVGVGGEVGDDLVAVRVAVAVSAGKQHPGQGALPDG